MGLDHFRYIYGNRAEHYQRMIAVEDVDGNLLPALRRAADGLAYKSLLDLGSGTGRIPCLTHTEAGVVTAYEAAPAMLAEQARVRAALGGTWGMVLGDMAALPFEDGSADVITAGWAIGHSVGWYPQDWQTVVGGILREIQRVLRPAGTVVIMETMTTGSLTPAPPADHLARYYHWLEDQWGFRCEIISTDYQFDSLEQAVEYTEFFFGSELAQKIRRNGWVRLPEWTGVWSWRKA